MPSFQVLLLVPAIFSLTLLSSPVETAPVASPKGYYDCARNSTFSPNSAYHYNIKTLLDWLSSNGTRITRFYNTTVAGKDTADTVYGLFYCSQCSDIKSCQDCVIEGAKLISTMCLMAKEAIVWRNICFVRYSNRRFFSTVEESPKISFMNDQDYNGNVGRFNNIVWDMMNDLRTRAASASGKSVYMSVNITDNQPLYGSAWCVPYLSSENCSWCLSDAIAEIPTSCCRGKSGGRVIYPSCGVRFELYPFFNTSTSYSLPAPAHSPAPTLAVGNDITTLESLRFDLAEIEVATSRFSKENKIGQGGFGEVYKGILSDGQEIAVKRLIGSSGQDPEKRRQLPWSERYKIIGGIARGILYLHEDSCLKIIHRDLKPSNVLLDCKMNLKISDFGIARIVIADQTEESTCRIVGTYGYMSPEYAMHGQYSVKSDIFSFGVMVLEIICGKRKSCSNESECFNDIRRYAWTKWTDQKPLELLDSSLEGSYSQEEVIKCIHIGLLCVQDDPNDRPTMATIVFYLNSPSVNMPLPHEPAFFKHRGEQHKMPRLETTSDSFSINEISLTTKFFPR